MSWIIFAIGAHFFWAIGNVADKYVVSHRVKNPYVYQVWLTMLSAIYIVFIPFVDFVIPRGINLWLLFIGAMLFLFGSFPYIKAMQIEEASRVNLWWNLIPVFSLLLGWLFLGETLSLGQIIAFCLLLSGGLIASLHLGGRYRSLRFSRAFYLMVLACILYALYGVILRYVGGSMNPISSFLWLNILMLPLVPFLFFHRRFRQDFLAELRGRSLSFLGLLFLILTVGDLALLFNITALRQGPVALVFAMEGWQAVFVFLLAVIITLFRPRLLKEDLTTANTLLKIAALLMIVVGVVLAYIA